MEINLRSKPGEGRAVELYFLHTSFSEGEEPGQPLLWTHTKELVEDFSSSTSPIVVKIDPECDRGEVVEKLRELANLIEAGGPD